MVKFVHATRIVWATAGHQTMFYGTYVDLPDVPEFLENPDYFFDRSFDIFVIRSLITQTNYRKVLAAL